MIAEEIQFEAELTERATDEPALVIDVEGFEGPLDLLLTLARQQKVDLAKISILALADQYLAFIEEARKLRLELAADYLVMAAWLAYLKSRLLLPEQHEPDGISAEDMATALAQRLRRLEAMMVVINDAHSLLITGQGDVVQPSDGIIGIGSGGAYALAAARALMNNTKLAAAEIVRRALVIASEIDVYTNANLIVEEMKCSK